VRRLETPRLLLEPQVAAHAEALFDVLSDPAIYEFENAPPISLEWLRERFIKLETRRSGDGSEQWLNWVVCERGGAPVGYVQATVQADGRAFMAYELGSAFWGRGLGPEAVAAMIDELAAGYGVHTVQAVFKRANFRSRRLLGALGFVAPGVEDLRHFALEADEDALQRAAVRRLPWGSR
jgi:[ribosomal protein S5]-alanine N-acetyltransferase